MLSGQAAHTKDFSFHMREALFESRADAIVATDRDGVIRIWNAGAIRIFGFGVEEAIGRPLDIIIPENLLPLHWQGYRNVMETGRSRYGEGEILSVPALTKSGRRISVEFTITAVRDDEVNLIGLVAIMRDVTSRFQELKLLRSKVAASGHPRSSS
jgi:PAS domain S-box-containing protein